jgi:hypothetical protein
MFGWGVSMWLWFNGLNGIDPSLNYHMNTLTNAARFCEMILSFYCNIYYHIRWAIQFTTAQNVNLLFYGHNKVSKNPTWPQIWGVGHQYSSI